MVQTIGRPGRYYYYYSHTSRASVGCCGDCGADAVPPTEVMMRCYRLSLLSYVEPRVREATRGGCTEPKNAQQTCIVCNAKYAKRKGRCEEERKYCVKIKRENYTKFGYKRNRRSRQICEISGRFKSKKICTHKSVVFGVCVV